MEPLRSRLREKPLVQPFSNDPALAMEHGRIAYNTRSGPGTENNSLRVGFTGGSQEEWVARVVPDCLRDQLAVHLPSGSLAVLQVVDEGKSVLACSYEMTITVPLT